MSEYTNENSSEPLPCAMCRGSPIFRVRYNRTFVKCSVCGNGFEVYKSDFEKNRPNADEKHWELVAMWNVKQVTNDKFMRTNEWVRRFEVENEIRGNADNKTPRKIDEAREQILDAIDTQTLVIQKLEQTVKDIKIPDQTPMGGWGVPAVSCGTQTLVASYESFDGTQVTLTPSVTATEPAEEEPVAEGAVVEPAGEEVIIAEEPVTEEVEEVAVEEQEIVVEEPVNVANPDAPDSVPAEEPVVEEPVEDVEEKTAETPVAEPVETDEPVEEEPEPVTEEPVADEPAEEPVAEEPKGNPLEGLSLDEIQHYLQDLLAKKSE